MILRELPSFILMAVLVGGGVWYATSMYYSAHYQERLEATEERRKLAQSTADNSEAIITRYRKRNGDESNSGTLTLIEMTNGELKKKATLLVKEIRALWSSYAKQHQELEDLHEKKEIEDTEFAKREKAIMTAASEEYTAQIRTEALKTMKELKNRVPKEKRNQFPTILPNLKSADPRDPPVGLESLLPPPGDFLTSPMIAENIDLLVSLLPDE